jgi:hypothetical protein
MKLYDICKEIAEIEEKLYSGEIAFVYDNLASAMKQGHPSEILDDILANIGWDVFANKEPPLSKVKKTVKELKTFQRVFKVDLKAQIKALSQYIEEAEKQA